MGAVAGHMDHPYDNLKLTFGGLKDMLEKASNGELVAQEKVDGQNLFLSYTLDDGEMEYIDADSPEEAATKIKGRAKSARNKGHLRSAGMNAEQLAQKFAGHSRPGIYKAFVSAFDAFETAVEALPYEDKLKIFGPDTNNWYNAEVMDPGSTRADGSADPDDPGAVNVIKYDDKMIKIHDVGHFDFNRETGEKTPIPEGSFELLDASMDKMQEALQGHDFKIARDALIQLQAMEDKLPLKRAIQLINEEMNQEGLKDSDTIQDYLYRRLYNGIDAELSPELKDNIVKYILGLPGNIGLRALKKGLNPEDLQDLNAIVNAKKSLRLQAIEPIEIAVHNFAVELLKGLQSIFIANPDKEIKRLRTELARVVDKVKAQGAKDPARMDVLKRHLNKIKDFNQISTSLEAIVFDYDGHTYKFSGNFAPLNQIMGLEPFDEAKVTTEGWRDLLKPFLKEDKEKMKSEPSKAERFVLSLPKFTPTEAWGDPNSMERQQIQRIFDTVGGGATIQEKLKFLNDTIENPGGGISSTRRIISTLILLESIKAVIGSFGEAPAGFVFEGFMAGLLRGKQVAGRSEKGNLPIQDLIAFSEIGGGKKSVPVSLKLLKGLAPGKKGKITNIEGSYTNLIDSLEEFGLMVYIVGRKDGERIVLEKFTFTRDNFIDALVTGSKGEMVKEADLFVLPDMDRSESLELLRSTDDWPTKYELLQQTAGYDPKERARKLSRKEKEESITVTDEMPDGEDIEVTADEVEAPANRSDMAYSVKECRRLWNKKLSEALLTESSGGRQWSISPAQLKRIAPQVDYESLGSLPYSSKKIVQVAEQYMKYLSDNLLNVFEATKDLSENINQYFTFRQRSQGIAAGEKAIQDSETISTEMSKELAQDAQVEEGLIKESAYTADISDTSEKQGKNIALFPGKFKPPHRGHYEFAKKVAKRLGPSGELVIMVSPIGKPEVSPEQSLKIWNKYLEAPDAPDNIHVEIADYRSPVTSVYEFISDPVKAREGDTVLLIKSSKDEGDTRYDGAQSYAARKNPGVAVDSLEEEPVVRPDGEPYHGQDAREAISDDNLESFKKFLPTKANAEEIWNIVKPLQTVEREIDKVMDEMSTMSGGDVSGGSGLKRRGHVNRYNPFDTNIYNTSPGQRAKIKRPQRKKPKRQRRR